MAARRGKAVAGAKAAPKKRTRRRGSTGAPPPPARAGAAGAPAEPRLLPRPGSVTVRMYRQGLGDCFLLAFAGKDRDRPTYVLIDCGVHMRQKNGTARLAQVMKNIKEATGGEIDVVVATHEHADHLSGFVQKNSPFITSDIEVKQFWVAWTERVGDTQADKLRKRRGAAREAIRRAAERLEKLGDEAKARRGEDRGAGLLGLMDFEVFAPDSLGLDGRAGAANLGVTAADGKARRKKKKDKPSSNEVALEFLGRHSDRIVYCEPGDTVAVPGVATARAHVLGPPRQEKLLERDKPQSGPSQETYLTGRSEQQTFILAPGLGVTRSDLGDTNMPENLRYPFDWGIGREYAYESKKGRVRWEAGAEIPKATRAIADRYATRGDEWRTIESDWLNGAEDLALHLDNDTNNTSLVLAFEVGRAGAGDVLLFVGDAQVGNWLSWRGRTFESGRVRQSTDDLLRRTVLYKVGHHGSHNATVKLDPEDKSDGHPNGVPYGLELMPSRLIALIPVDREAAQREMPKPWSMPHGLLYKRLIEKAEGRVLRSDGQPPESKLNIGHPKVVTPRRGEPEDVPGMPNCEWCESDAMFEAEPHHPLYYQIEFLGKAAGLEAAHSGAGPR